jgi:hypothetical protein
VWRAALLVVKMGLRSVVQKADWWDDQWVDSKEMMLVEMKVVQMAVRRGNSMDVSKVAMWDDRRAAGLAGLMGEQTAGHQVES